MEDWIEIELELDEKLGIDVIEDDVKEVLNSDKSGKEFVF
jgi:hypothetical protein